MHALYKGKGSYSFIAEPRIDCYSLIKEFINTFYIAILTSREDTIILYFIIGAIIAGTGVRANILVALNLY